MLSPNFKLNFLALKTKVYNPAPLSFYRTDGARITHDLTCSQWPDYVSKIMSQISKWHHKCLGAFVTHGINTVVSPTAESWFRFRWTEIYNFGSCVFLWQCSYLIVVLSLYFWRWFAVIIWYNLDDVDATHVCNM